MMWSLPDFHHWYLLILNAEQAILLTLLLWFMIQLDQMLGLNRFARMGHWTLDFIAFWFMRWRTEKEKEGNIWRRKKRKKSCIFCIFYIFCILHNQTPFFTSVQKHITWTVCGLFLHLSLYLNSFLCLSLCLPLTRCQIWCTIELHRDPILKVLSEW